MICDYCFNQVLDLKCRRTMQGVKYKRLIVSQLSQMRKKSGKVGITELSHIERKDYEPSALSNSSAIYLTEEGGLKYEFLLRPKKKSSLLFVLFSGDAIRKKYQPPVFQRWSWSKYFPGHCVYFSDPVLHLDPRIGLGWYSGTKESDTLTTIARIVNEIASHLKVDSGNIVSYGSSGGGFAALRLTSLLGQGVSICINPQITTYKYLPKHFNRYVDVCYPGMSTEEVVLRYPDRVDLTTLGAKIKRQRIIYMQNLDDTHHVEEHYKPFCASIGEQNPLEQSSSCSNFNKVLFNDPRGHAKAESAGEFKRAMQILENLQEGDRS